MNTEELELAMTYIRLAKGPDNRELKDWMHGRSAEFREQIKRTLKSLDVYNDVPVRLLNVEPRQRREGRMSLQELQAHLRLRQSGWDSQTDKAMQRAVRVWVNGGSMNDVLEAFDEHLKG